MAMVNRPAFTDAVHRFAGPISQNEVCDTRQSGVRDADVTSKWIASGWPTMRDHPKKDICREIVALNSAFANRVSD